jgi:hypothetical protein
MRRLVLVALLIGACQGGPTPSPTPLLHTVTGTFTLVDADPSRPLTGPCGGTGGYADIQAGLGVVLKDQAGTILATGSLVPVARTAVSRECPFSFTLNAVPDTATFYAIEVGHRGSVTKSHAEMDAAGWTFALTLGGG